MLLPLRRTGTAKPPAADARCLIDADCAAAGQQCDVTTSSNRLNYYTCSGGFDTPTTYGKCVAIPARPQATPQQMCNSCLRTVRAFVDTVLNGTRTPDAFNTACLSYNYTMSACGMVQAAIAASHNKNLARRTGSLCIRLGECNTAGGYAVSAVSSVAPAAVVAPAPSPAPVVNGTNATVASDPVPAGPGQLSGALDSCTVEGVVGGELVLGTFSVAGKLLRPGLLDRDHWGQVLVYVTLLFIAVDARPCEVQFVCSQHELQNVVRASHAQHDCFNLCPVACLQSSPPTAHACWTPTVQVQLRFVVAPPGPSAAALTA
jgi:hypothetical protein